MELTDGEKQKIEEEERFRNQIRSEIAEKPKKKSSFLLLAFLLVVGVFGLSVITASKNSSSTPSTTTPPSEEQLVGSVQFDGTQFHVANQDNKAWENCLFRTTGNYQFPSEQGLLGADTARIEPIEANTVYSIGASQLTLKDGERFNPFSTKPKD